MKLILSLNQQVVTQLKLRVPVRKRSLLIENLLGKFFDEQDKDAGWKAMSKLRFTYDKSADPINNSSVDWLSEDRRKH